MDDPLGDPLRDPWQAPMSLALEEAERAPETGDVPVGAVLLGPDGAVLARGRNEREATGDPTAHAEVLAIRRAARQLGTWRLTGCTLLVTLEPCTMCAGAIVLSRLERVVYGAVDEKAGAVGSLWDVVRDRRLNHRPEVIHSVRAKECAGLLTDFFRGREPGQGRELSHLPVQHPPGQRRREKQQRGAREAETGPEAAAQAETEREGQGQTAEEETRNSGVRMPISEPGRA